MAAAPYGVTPEGFSRPSVVQSKEEIERDELASIDPTLDVSTDPVVGQINGIFAQHLGKAWEALQTCHEALDPDKAEDFLLTSLAKLTGTTRRPATYSLVTLTCTFDNSGVVLESGVNFANVLNRPDLRFTPVEDFESTGAGDTPVVFRAENKGPVFASGGTITVIATSVTGWTAVTNANDATVGRDVETDAELRLRRQAELAKPGSARVAAIKADLLELNGIISVVAFENRTGLRDENGLPPHSFEMVIWAGDPFAADTSEIGQAIFDSRAGGAESFGGTSGLANTGEQPPIILEHFSLATVRAVYLVFDIVAGDDFVGATAFKAAIATRLNDRTVHDIGDDVISERVQGLVFESTLALGVADLDDFKLGFSASPTGTENLAVDKRAIARFDTTRITVNLV